MSVTIPLDPELEAAAAWRGLSPDAYVRAVIAQAVADDAALAGFARESLDPGATVSRRALDAWFDAQRKEPRD